MKKKVKLKIKTPFQINSIEGQDKISAIIIKDDRWKTEKIKTDCVLGFFGLIMKLGPIAEWGLNLDKKAYTSDMLKIFKQIKKVYLQLEIFVHIQENSN